MLYVTLWELELQGEDLGFGQMEMLVEHYLHANKESWISIKIALQ